MPKFGSIGLVVRMIQNIEEIGLELQFLVLFAELKAARNREVEDTVTWAGEGVATEISNVLGSGYAIASCVDSAGNRERRQVEILVRRAGPGEGISDQVRTSKEFARPVEIVLER